MCNWHRGISRWANSQLGMPNGFPAVPGAATIRQVKLARCTGGAGFEALVVQQMALSALAVVVGWGHGWLSTCGPGEAGWWA